MINIIMVLLHQYYFSSRIVFLFVGMIIPQNASTVQAQQGRWWQPKANDQLTWQWQLSNDDNINTNYNVDMYDIDLFEVSDDVIKTLHEQNKIVVCYFSAGSYEYYREDWSLNFPFINQNEIYQGNETPFGNPMNQWYGERWLDIRRLDLLSTIMKNRISYAAERKCDAIEPDNVDVYVNKEEAGLLDITYEDQLVYNKWLAQEAHAMNLSIALKNDVDQLQELVSHFDFAINEECFRYKECTKYNIFTNMSNGNKAVFGVEYTGSAHRFCRQANTMNLSFMKKRLELDAWRKGCEQRMSILQWILSWFGL
jgi:hypothetical protein